MKLSRQLRIFLLYARQDEATVHRLYRRLVRDGADVWMDRAKLLPGQNWAMEIHNAIYSSDITIACLTKQFHQQGGYRHEELKIALRRANSLPSGQIFLIPARLEACELPEPLARWQCVDLFESQGYKKLLQVIKECTAPP